MNFAQAITIANIRADATGVKQRISICRCDSRWAARVMGTPHYRVRPVDQIPEGAL